MFGFLWNSAKAAYHLKMTNHAIIPFSLFVSILYILYIHTHYIFISILYIHIIDMYVCIYNNICQSTFVAAMSHGFIYIYSQYLNI